jgi:hypothetical protein
MADEIEKVRYCLDFRYTYEYRTIAIIILFIGSVSLVISIPVSIFLIAVAVILLLVKSGLEIDLIERKARKLNQIGGINTGTWLHIADYQRIELRLTSESQTMSSGMQTSTYYTKTFDIVLVNEAGYSTELINYDRYGKAVEIMEYLMDIFNLPGYNRIEEALRKTIKKRRR